MFGAMCANLRSVSVTIADFGVRTVNGGRWWPMPGCEMITYEVTSTGAQGYQVTATSPEFQSVVVGDFASLQAAEAFADDMRKIDAVPGHSDCN
jgi:hypothetical protein